MSNRIFALGICSLLTACAGNGDGLDENGRPLSQTDDTLQANFDSIQDHVLTPICTTCHSGAAAPLGLRLDEGFSYALLVNAPSVEVPSINRVQPSNPDASYLIQKLEGTAAVGARMPLNGPALPPSTIAVVRQWIANGAPAGTATSMRQKPDLNVTQLAAVTPRSNEVLSALPRELVVQANAALDTSLLQSDLVTLRASGGDGDFTNGNETDVPFQMIIRSYDPTVLVLALYDARLLPDDYELRISGGAPLALTDMNARPIDGDLDGVAGGDFVLRFKVGMAL